MRGFKIQGTKTGRLPRYSNKGVVLRRDYTDLCIVLGPDRRWVETDYRELAEQRPETFLGYRVMLACPSDLLRGYRPSKVVFLADPLNFNTRYTEAAMVLTAAVNTADFPRVEQYEVRMAYGGVRLVHEWTRNEEN